MARKAKIEILPNSPSSLPIEDQKRLIALMAERRGASVGNTLEVKNRKPGFAYAWVSSDPQMLELYKRLFDAHIVGGDDPEQTQHRAGDGTHRRGVQILVRLDKNLAMGNQLLAEADSERMVVGDTSVVSEAARQIQTAGAPEGIRTFSPV